MPPEIVFKCKMCDVRAENYEKLRMHHSVYHSHNKETQVQENRVFEEFNCFYCDEKIISGENLEDHATNCPNVFDSLIKVPARYLEPCDAKCGPGTTQNSLSSADESILK